MIPTNNYYDVLIGISGLDGESTKLNCVQEVADFIDTHTFVTITEEDGTPLLEAENGGIISCNDLRYLNEELMPTLHKSDGFRGRYVFYGKEK